MINAEKRRFVLKLHTHCYVTDVNATALQNVYLCIIFGKSYCDRIKEHSNTVKVEKLNNDGHYSKVGKRLPP